MPCRRTIGALIAALLLTASPAIAQGASGLVVVRVALPDGSRATGALVEVTPVSRIALARAARIGQGALSWSMPPAVYRVRATLAGFQDAERTIQVEPGTMASVHIRLAAGTSAVTAGATALAYQVGFGAALLDALPSARTVPTLLETAHGFLIARRIDGGGIWTGDPARIGGQGSSATQATFRLGATDVTDPLLTGSPVFYPDLGVLEAVTTETADVDAAAAGPGPVITMVLRRPADAWSGSAQFFTTSSALVAEPGSIAPIARLDRWADGTAAAGGPLTDTFGLFAAARLTGSRRIEREVESLDTDVRSLTAHLIGHPRPGRELRVVASYTDVTRPSDTRARFADRTRAQQDRHLLLSASWDRAHEDATWSLAATYQRVGRDAAESGSMAGGVIERLRDGPPLGLVDGPRDHRQRWNVAFTLEPAVKNWLGREHVLRLGAALGGSSARIRGGETAPFGELVNGTPARVWDVAFLGPESRWGATSASAYVSDRIFLADTLTLSAALRLDLDRGSADGAPSGIGWANVSPRAALQWRPGASDAFVISTGYGWYRHRLPLGYFAVGDPAGPSGVMYRWDDANGDGAFASPELTAVAAVGLCCTEAGPSRIADDLARPTTRAFHIGFEHRLGSWRWGITGLDRREDDIVVLLNTGVTLDDYTVSYVEDPGVDIAGLQGFNTLPIYNRLPASFGRDQYVLANAPGEPTRHQAFEVTLARDLGDRWYFRFGGTAYRTEGVGAYLGYRADENDQGLIGDAYTMPNAGTSARGRLFYDRAFVMKVLGAYAPPGPFRAAAVARYQDGQPFSRVLIADGLNQGPELVQAYPRGGQRFTFTATLDARAELRWPLGAARTLGVSLDVFNLLNMDNEVEEDIVTGPAFRAITAVQPPRVVRLGVRLTF